MPRGVNPFGPDASQCVAAKPLDAIVRRFCIFPAGSPCYERMRPILRAITISTVIVVVYPFVVVALVWPLAALWGGPFGNTAYKALMMPLELPVFVMRLLNGSRDLGGRMPIEVLLLVFGWYFASNAAIYYLPVRLFLQWSEGRQRLR
jgi:hypothetical protein